MRTRVLVVCLVGGCLASAQNEPQAQPTAVATPSTKSPVATPEATPKAEAPADSKVDDAPDETAAPPAPVDSEIVQRKRWHRHAKESGLHDFVDALENDGTVWAGPLEGNGGRDVVIYIPPKPDDAAEVRLLYHFHGTYSEHIEAKRPGVKKRVWVGWDRLQQTIDAVDELQEKRPYNVALVYPLSAGKRPEPDHEGWFNKDYDRMWMVPTDDPDYRDSFSTLDREARALLTDRFGVHPTRLRKKVTAEGHSAGGLALRNVAVHGGDNVQEYIFEDANFQTWADGCYDAVVDGKTGALVTIVMTDEGIADPWLGRSPWCKGLQEAHRSWPPRKRACAADPKDHSVKGLSCEDHETYAEQWPEYETWCRGFQSDMADMPGVYLLRTKVRHSLQPRHFSGGLELPEDRFDSL